jgi:hypothetical protein
LQLWKKPYYNPRTLEEGPRVVKGKLIFDAASQTFAEKRARERPPAHW